MALRLHLLRHGETAWTLTGQHTGRTDIPLTPHGEEQARTLGEYLRGIPFVRVLTSPLQRARQTCQLTGLTPPAEIEPDLAEWDYGDYEGKAGPAIRRERPDWNIFRDGAPHGETPAQVMARADHLVTRLRAMTGDIALFTHGHFGRVLAARWLGLPVAQAQPFQLGTASHSILGREHKEPAIELWNHLALAPAPVSPAATSNRRALDRWENEGGEIAAAGSPRPGAPAGATRRRQPLVVFDLDGTLAQSKAPIDPEMAALLSELLGLARVAVISGGDWPQFEKQLLAHLPLNDRLGNLSLLPTCGTKFFAYAGSWRKLYSEDFRADEREEILGALRKAIAEAGCQAGQVWGETIEDRGSQITFSALGQQAPLEAKQKWDPDFTKRKLMKSCLDRLIPGFSVRLGGTTSIDVTKPGIDKAYGIRKLRDILGIAISEMIFIGDALFPGGNDYPAKDAGVYSIRVRDPDESKRIIEAVIACLRNRT
jgi:phosphomannomutase